MTPSSPLVMIGYVLIVLIAPGRNCSHSVVVVRALHHHRTSSFLAASLPSRLTLCTRQECNRLSDLVVRTFSVARGSPLAYSFAPCHMLAALAMASASSFASSFCGSFVSYCPSRPSRRCSPSVVVSLGVSVTVVACLRQRLPSPPSCFAHPHFELSPSVPLLLGCATRGSLRVRPCISVPPPRQVSGLSSDPVFQFSMTPVVFVLPSHVSPFPRGHCLAGRSPWPQSLLGVGSFHSLGVWCRV